MARFHRPLLLLLAVGMYLTLCRPAEAYIDAGSGSYVLQILFATLFGAAFTVKSTFANIKAAMLAKRAQRSETKTGA